MKSCLYPAAAAVLLVSCAPPETDTLLSMVVETDVTVDTLCEDGCGGAEMANAMVEFAAHPLLPQTAQFEVLQYRITYTFDGAPADAEPYAQETWAVARQGSQAPVGFEPVGEVQREWARTSFGLERTLGEATLEMAGYDHNNVLIVVSDTFPMAFEDLTVQTNPTE